MTVVYLLVRLLALVLLLTWAYDGSRSAVVIVLAYLVGINELQAVAYRRTLHALVEAEQWRARVVAVEAIERAP